jgi:hypothetical protein
LDLELETQAAKNEANAKLKKREIFFLLLFTFRIQLKNKSLEQKILTGEKEVRTKTAKSIILIYFLKHYNISSSLIIMAFLQKKLQK